MPYRLPVDITFFELVSLRVAYEGAHRIGRNQDFECGSPPARGRPSQQLLADDPGKRVGKLRAHVVAQMLGESVHDPLDALGGTSGVQGRDHEVSGLCRGERAGHRFGVAHFADDDDVRIGAQYPPQRGRKTRRVATDLALRHERAPALVTIFDRILDRDDAARRRLVDPVYYGRHRRRFAGAGGTGEDYETMPFQSQPGDRRRNVE